MASAPRASAATSSSDAPPRATAAAATAPSTSGASLSSTRSPPPSSSIGHLRAHQRAAEVHQDEHAVRRRRPLDRGLHPRGVGAHRPVVEAPGRLDAHLAAAHLPGELDHTGGELGAVGDDDEPDH